MPLKTQFIYNVMSKYIRMGKPNASYNTKYCQKIVSKKAETVD